MEQKYVFLITRRGSHAAIKASDLQIYDLDGLMAMPKGILFHNVWATGIRIASINNHEKFDCKLLKQIKVEDFNDIFKGRIQELQANGLLDYSPNSKHWFEYKQPIFHASVYKKYGIALSKIEIDEKLKTK